MIDSSPEAMSTGWAWSDGTINTSLDGSGLPIPLFCVRAKSCQQQVYNAQFINLLFSQEGSLAFSFASFVEVIFNNQFQHTNFLGSILRARVM